MELCVLPEKIYNFWKRTMINTKKIPDSGYFSNCRGKNCMHMDDEEDSFVRLRKKWQQNNENTSAKQRNKP